MDEDRRKRRRQLRNVASSGGDDRPRSDTRSDDRAQSEVLGVVLLIGLVVVSVTTLGIFGTQAVTEQQRTAANSQAERGFEQLDTRASRVALGEESAQTVDLGLVDNFAGVHADERGWIRVTVSPEESPTKTVTNTSLGTVYYERDGTTVAYQGGGVFRADDGNATMLSRPEFHLNDETLNLPIVSVSGEPGLTDTVRVAKNGSVERTFPDASRNLTNRLESGTITVTVQSDYYRAWGRYFEEETQGVVAYDDPAEQVSVTFFAIPDVRQLDVGIIATSASGKLAINGTGAYVDSYDSSEGGYSATKNNNGNIRSAGDVVMGGSSDIYGDVSAGGFIDMAGTARINGSAEYTDPPAPPESQVDGTVTQIDGVASVPPINSFVAAYGKRIRDNADNAQTSNITGNQLSFGASSTVELGAGNYYLEHIDLSSGETLVLDTTNGDIRIAVRDWVKLSDGDIKIVGDGSVDMVVESRTKEPVSITGLGTRDVNFHVGKGSEVDLPGRNSNRLTVFGPQNFTGTIAGSGAATNNATFNGIIFAPAGATGSGYVWVKQGDAYGLITTGNLIAGQSGAIHYDRGIDSDPAADTTLSQLEYLHVNVHRVDVTSG